MKIFQIGFNKCGRSSIWDRLNNALGLRSCYLKTDDGRYVAKVMKDNLAEDRHILHSLEDYSGFTDLEYLGEDEFVEAYRSYR